jgi:putative PIN family toxin of toxin-antitoxin system
MRVVLDTNVLLAAFATRGLCEAVFQVCLEQHQIILSQHILRELRRHLTVKLKVPVSQAGRTLAFLREHAEIVEPAKVSAKTCSDRNDLSVLGTTQAGKVDFLITGDKDLLDLKTFHSIPILTPRAFYDRLR